MRVIEPTKRCADCRERKPWSDFYPRTYWPDGSVRNVTAYCKACSKERVRQYERDNPEATRAKWRRASRARWSTPERAANRYAYECAHRGYVAGRRRKVIGSEARVDSAVFVAWFEGVMERDGTNRTATAERLGVTEKGIRLMQSGDQPTVELATVERALFADDTITLRDLYPSLYLEAA